MPEGIEEILPVEAKQLEELRRKILDTFSCWGYELVITPFIDFLDSLLIGSGHDLELQTFKLTDQISGKTLGVRADMTPQVARIDARNSDQQGSVRLCYAGTVLHTKGDALEKTRSPMQIGAELYGHAGLESDLEIIRLMLEMLAIAGLQSIHLDLGHVGIFRALSKQAQLTAIQEAELFDVLQRKARPELQVLIDSYAIDDAIKHMFFQLPLLNGDRNTIEKARILLSAANDEVKQALTELEIIAEKLASYLPFLPISYDLAELRGYHYHTGIVFAAFVPTVGREIARGGRYDNIGAVFGRARPATGFSADLRVLSSLTKTYQCSKQLIYAPYQNDLALTEKIRELRAKGLAVVQQLPGQFDSPEALGCTAVLELDRQNWFVRTLS